ncbi:MAG: ferritin-like domain-containing protein [Solirubrobacterales bacterium]|nr:ferritin-like domain-containing protein [Solirubrobacterales bacterium]
MAPRERIVISDGPADSAVVAEFERDRRDLLRRGLGLGGAVIAASSIPLFASVRNAFAATGGDAEILSSAIHLEQVAVLAYGAAIDSGRLTPSFAKVLTRFRDHEQEHADALTTALTDLGGTPPKNATAADVETVVKGLAGARSQRDIVNLAIVLEMATVAAYHDAHRKLVDAKLLQAGASIMATQAQHLVVLRQAVRSNPVPHAFEVGKA